MCQIPCEALSPSHFPPSNAKLLSVENSFFFRLEGFPFSPLQRFMKRQFGGGGGGGGGECSGGTVWVLGDWPGTCGGGQRCCCCCWDGGTGGGDTCDTSPSSIGGLCRRCPTQKFGTGRFSNLTGIRHLKGLQPFYSFLFLLVSSMNGHGSMCHYY